MVVCFSQRCGLSHVLQDEDVLQVCGLGCCCNPSLLCADMFAWRLAVGGLQVVKKTVAQQRADKNYGQKVQAYYDKYKEKKRKKKPLKS